MSNEINVKINLVGNTSGFEPVINGLKSFQGELIKVGKELANTSKQGMSEFLIKASKEIGNVVKTMSSFGSAATLTQKEMDKFTAAEEKMAKMGKLASDMFAVLAPAVKSGEMSLATAEKEALKYAQAMEFLKRDTVLAANVMTGFTNAEKASETAMASLNKNLTLQQVLALQDAKALEITAGGFKFLTQEAYKAFVTDELVITGLTKLQGNLLPFQTEMKKAANASTEFKEALSKVAVAAGATSDSKAGMNVAVFEKQVKVLKQVESAIQGVGATQEKFTASELQAVSSIDRFNVVSAINLGHINATASGLKILNQAGLQAFGNISLETAGKMGILDKSFDVFTDKLGKLQRLTGASDSSMLKMKEGLISSGKSFTDLGLRIDETTAKFKGITYIKDLRKDFSGLLTSMSPVGVEAKKVLDVFTAKVNTTPLSELKSLYASTASELKKLSVVHTHEQKALESSATTISRVTFFNQDLLKSETELAAKGHVLIDVFKKEGGDAVILQKALSNLSAEFKKQEKEVESVTKKVNSLESTYTAVFKGSSDFTGRMNALIASQRKEGTEVEALRVNLQNLFKEYTSLQHAEEAEIQKIKKLNLTYSEIGKGNKEYIASLKQLFTSYNESGGSVATLEANLKKLATEFKLLQQAELNEMKSIKSLRDTYTEVGVGNNKYIKSMNDIFLNHIFMVTSVDTLRGQLRNLAKEYTLTQKVEAKEAETLSALKLKYEDMVRTSATYTESIKKPFAVYKSGEISIEQLKLSLEKLGREFTTLSNAQSKFPELFKDVGQAKQKLDELTTKFKNGEITNKEYSNSIAILAASLSKYQKEQKAIVDGSDSMGRMFKDVIAKGSDEAKVRINALFDSYKAGTIKLSEFTRELNKENSVYVAGLSAMEKKKVMIDVLSVRYGVLLSSEQKETVASKAASLAANEAFNAYKKTGEGVEVLIEKLKIQQTLLNQDVANSKKVAAEQKAVSDEVNRLRNSYKDLGEASKAVGAVLAKGATDKSSLKTMTEDLKKASAAYKDQEKDAKKLADGLYELNRNYKELAKTSSTAKSLLQHGATDLRTLGDLTYALSVEAKAVKEVEQAQKKMSDEAVQASHKLGLLKSSVTELYNSSDHVKRLFASGVTNMKEFDNLKVVITQLNASFKEEKSRLEEVQFSTEKFEKSNVTLLGSLTPLGEKARQLVATYSTMGGSSALLGIELKELNRELTLQTTSAEKVSNKLKDCNIKYSDLLGSTTKEGVAANKVTQEFINGEKTIGEYTQTLSKLEREFTKQQNAQKTIVDTSNLLRRVYRDLLASNTEGANAAESFFKKYESGKIPLEIFKKELLDINKVYTATLTEEKKREVSLNRLMYLYETILGGTSKQSAEMWKLLSAYEATGAGADTLEIRLKKLSSEWVSETKIADKLTEGLRLLNRDFADLAAKSGKAERLLKNGAQDLKELSDLTAALKLEAKAVKDVEDAQRKAAAEAVQATHKLDLLKSSVIELYNSSNHVKRLFDAGVTNMKEFERLKVIITQLNASFKETIAINEKLVSLKNTFNAVLNSSTAMGNSATSAWASFHAGTITIKQLEAALKLADKSLRDYGRQVDSLKNRKEGLDKMIGKLTNSMASYARYMISSTILQGLQSAFSGVTDEIINHDQALHDLQAITQSTDSEILTLNKTLIEVANSTKYTMTEVAEGMKQMAQAGYNTQEIAGGIEAIANLATGAAESLSTAINLVTSTMATFDMGMEDSAKVADMFANAVTSSRLTISGLNTTMSYIGPAAVNANIPLKDLMATLEMLSQAGMRASTQGTGMTELLSKLANPTEKFKKAVLDAGFALEDFDTQTNDWRSVMEKMITLFDGSGEAIGMFGTRAARVALALKTQGVSAFDEFSRGLDRTGTANQMAEKSMEGLATMVIRLKTNLTILGTEILHSAVEPLRTLLGLLLDGVAAMKEFAESGLGKVISATTVWIAALASLALAVKVFTLVAGFKGSLLVLATQLILTGNATLALQMSMDKLALTGVTLITRIKGLAIAFGGLLVTLPGAIIAGITLLIGAAIVSWYAWKKAIEDTIQANNEYSVGLKSVRTEIDAYNKAVAEHGAESEEAKKVLETLNKVITATGEQTKSTKTLMEQFASSLGGASGSTEKTTTVISQMSKVLQDELNKKLDESIRLLEGMRKAVEQPIDTSFDLASGFDNSVISKIETATEQLTRLREEAEKGSESAKKLLAAYADGASNWAEGLRETEGAANLTNAQIEKMAADLVKTKEGFSPIAALLYADALKKVVKEQQKVAETAQATAIEAESLAGVIKQVNVDIEKMQTIPTDKAEKYIGDLTALQKDFDNWRITELNTMSQKVATAAQKERNEIDAGYKALTSQMQTELEKQLGIRETVRDKMLAIANEQLQKDLSWAGDNNDAKIAAHAHYEQAVKEIQERYSSEKKQLLENDDAKRVENAEELAKLLEDVEVRSTQAQIDILNQKRAIFLQANADRIADLEEHAQAHKALYEEMYAEEKSLLEQNLAAQNEALKGTDQTENQILIKKSQNQREYYQKLLDLEKKALGEAEKLEQGRAESYSQITEQMTEEGTRHFSNVSLAQKQAAEESMKIHSSVSEDGIKHFWNTAEEEKKSINESSKVMQDKFKDQETLIKASVALKKKDGDTDVELAKKAKSELYKLGKEQLKDQISTLKERQAKYKEVIAGLKALEASLTDAIIAEKKKIKDIDKDFVDIAREMRQSAMSEEKIYAEEENRLNQLVAQQQAAYLKGEGELVDEIKGKIIELAKEQMNRANADKEGIKDGEKIVLTESQKAANAEKYLEFIRQASLTSQEMSKKTVTGLENEKSAAQAKAKEVEEGLKKTEDILKKVMNDYTKFTSVSLESLEDLNDQMDKLIKKNMSKPVTDFNTATGDAKTKVDAVSTSLTTMIASEKNAAIEANKLAGAWERVAKAAREAASAGRDAKAGGIKSATGGPIPGYGGGDIVPATLEPGEWVIRKEAVKQVGQSFMRRLNAGLVQPFATGGMVSTKNVSTTQIIENNPVINNFSTNIMDKLKDFGTVKLNFGNNTIPVMAHQNVIAELSRHMRRESLMGAN